MRRLLMMTGMFLVINTLVLGGLTLPQHSYDGLACLQLISFQQNRGRSGQFNHYLIDARTGFMALQREDAMWIPVSSSPRVRVMARLMPRNTQDMYSSPRYEIGLVALDALGNVNTRRIMPIAMNISMQTRSIYSQADQWMQSLLWSPDWTQLAMRWEDTTRQNFLTLVNEDGTNIRTFPLKPMTGGGADVLLAWSPDSRYLLMQASYGDPRFSLWDTQAFREIALPYTAQLSALVWSPTAAILSGIVRKSGEAPSIWIFSPADGTQHLTALPAQYDPNLLVWSPTGTHVAIIGYQLLTTQASNDDPKTYLFVSADGTLLPATASGIVRQWVRDNLAYVVYAGIWSTRGDRWYFLKDVPNSVPTMVSLLAFDIDSGTSEVIEDSVPLTWAAEIFNEPLQEFAASLSIGTFTFNPLTPMSQRPNARRDLIIVTEGKTGKDGTSEGGDGAAINIDFFDTETRQHTRIVTEADRLSADDTGMGGQLRLRGATPDDTWIAIQWVKEGRQHLSWLKADGSHRYQIDEIPPLAQVTRNGDYLSYRRYDGDQQWSVMLLDLRSGQQQTLLSNLPPFDEIRSAPAPQGDSMAVVVRSGLYVAAMDGSWSKQIDPAVRQLPWWSPELQGENRLAYLKMAGAKLRIVVSDAQGEELLDKNVALPNANVVLRNIGLIGWSRCPE